MALSPRANETEAVKAILESTIPVLDENGDPLLDAEGEPLLEPEHDSAEAMAKAIVRALGAEFARRENYVIIPPGSPIAYGPYWTERDAERAWTKDVGTAFDGQARLLRSYPWDPPALELPVCACGHYREQHVVPGPKNKPGKPSECGHYNRSKQRCECASFTPRKSVA